MMCNLSKQKVFFVIMTTQQKTADMSLQHRAIEPSEDETISSAGLELEQKIKQQIAEKNKTKAARRRMMHRRTLTLQFYELENGLFEIEGRLRDIKTDPFKRVLYQEPWPPGEPIHDIKVHLIVDRDMLVHDLWADMQATPFRLCLQAQATLTPLIGRRIAKGWNKAVRDTLGGSQSCTHIMEMLGPMATTAFQGLAPQRMEDMNRPENEHLRVGKVDSCFTYGAQRTVVAQIWPHLHKPENDN